ncbi:hypothetical protein G9A89_023845 [Geosiphon pyriformis]|nr:hypothetical protein G9A89_023845 [Geosiphon pyriformis]
MSDFTMVQGFLSCNEGLYDMENSNRSPTREDQSLNMTAPQGLRASVNPQMMQQPHLLVPPPYRPLLPAGWTEHRAPNGMFYYYNASTGQSTWERPVMLLPPPPMGVSSLGGTSLGPVLHSSPFQPMPGLMGIGPPQQLSKHQNLPQGQNISPQTPKKEKRKEKKKKEKAKGKKYILNCIYNISHHSFDYFRKQIGETTWYIVKTTEGNEFYFNSETKQSVWEIPEEILEDVKKIKEQEQAEEAYDQTKLNEHGSSKRKTVDEAEDGSSEDVSKRARNYGDSGGAEGTELTADDIAYQLQCMEEEQQQLEQMEAIEDNHEPSIEDLNKNKYPEGNSNNGSEIEKRDKSDISKEVELSPEERILMFKSLLRDMNVSPFAMWEKELPRIIHDPRYTIIATLKQRKEIFDEYCKEKVVELRGDKKNQAKTQSAQEGFIKLLEEETSYRTHWDDFRRKFKRDSRFKNYSDEKEKEKIFRDHIQKLKDHESQKRRAQKKKAEEEFFGLLRETREIKYDSSWRKVKRLIDEDRRYEAVESSAEREHLFREFCRKLEAEDEQEMSRKEEERKQKERKAREEASLRKREAQVRKELSFHNRSKDTIKRSAIHEEGVLAFQSLLIDLVRNHQVTWEEKKADLERDPRFNSEGLTAVDKLQLFEEHLTSIYQKRLKAFHELLDQHVQLDTTWIELLSIIREDPRAVRLSKKESVLESLFDQYFETRIQKAKTEFKELLKENKFVEYRTRMMKLSEDGATDETGTAKEKVLGLTSEEIHDVLKDDQRYLALNHMPEVRDELIHQYLNHIEAPSMTVHQGRD